MCNDYENHIRYDDYAHLMRQLDIGIAEHQSQADLPRADDIRIGNIGPVIQPSGNGVKLTPMTFGFPPKGRGGPVFNFRSEGRHFGDSRRCLIPASAFFEFTGTKSPKAKHRFTLGGAPFLAIAGLWRDGEGNQPPAFTMLTTEPGPDVAPYHDRQVVVLRPERWADWLWLTRPEADLLKPLPAGTLAVETVRKGADQLQAEQV